MVREPPCGDSRLLQGWALPAFWQVNAPMRRTQPAPAKRFAAACAAARSAAGRPVKATETTTQPPQKQGKTRCEVGDFTGKIVKVFQNSADKDLLNKST